MMIDKYLTKINHSSGVRVTMVFIRVRIFVRSLLMRQIDTTFNYSSFARGVARVKCIQKLEYEGPRLTNNLKNSFGEITFIIGPFIFFSSDKDPLNDIYTGFKAQKNSNKRSPNRLRYDDLFFLLSSVYILG